MPGTCRVFSVMLICYDHCPYFKQNIRRFERKRWKCWIFLINSDNESYVYKIDDWFELTIIWSMPLELGIFLVAIVLQFLFFNAGTGTPLYVLFTDTYNYVKPKKKTGWEWKTGQR